MGRHCFRLNVGWRKSVWHNWRSTERITRHAGWGGLTCDFRVGISVRFFPGGFSIFWHHQISWLEVGVLVGESVILQIHDFFGIMW